jgi:hypothetical protein
MALQSVKRAQRRPEPVKQPKKTGFGQFLDIAQGVGGLAAATGHPLGAAVSGGAGLLRTITADKQFTSPGQQQQTMSPMSVERVDTGPAISRRMDLAQTDPVADLLQAQSALQDLPEEQRRQFEKPIGLALAEQQRRFS